MGVTAILAMKATAEMCVPLARSALAAGRVATDESTERFCLLLLLCPSRALTTLRMSTLVLLADERNVNVISIP
jgi:hypothetical protein